MIKKKSGNETRVSPSITSLPIFHCRLPHLFGCCKWPIGTTMQAYNPPCIVITLPSAMSSLPPRPGPRLAFLGQERREDFVSRIFFLHECNGRMMTCSRDNNEKSPACNHAYLRTWGCADTRLIFCLLWQGAKTPICFGFSFHTLRSTFVADRIMLSGSCDAVSFVTVSDLNAALSVPDYPYFKLWGFYELCCPMRHFCTGKDRRCTCMRPFAFGWSVSKYHLPT